ncbi:AAA family ATPase [Nocardia sp. bgisy118]|uniref:AAA family ATPase n=1 Tax=Nocardia sp. bgisy118 TaxID=3413786 RepID=UPI003F4A6B70
MKPITLAMKGFRSYPEPATIDFTDKGLTAVLGDTGAGKSSILEAITFALFGKSSWDGRETKLLIADHADIGSVELTFTHGGHRWQVHRTIHATNSNAGRHHLKNFDTGEEVDGATAVTSRIEAVLQLGYNTFLRVGLLPQGKFDQLLTSKPSERKKHLRELFGADSLEAVQDVARERASELKALLEQATEKRKGMPDKPEQTTADCCSKASAAETLAARLVTSIDTISTLQEKVSTARGASVAAQKAADNLADGVVHDAVATLDKLAPIAEHAEKQRASLVDSAAKIKTRERGLVEQIRQREQAGEGLSPLADAAAILAHLPDRIEGHRQKRFSLETRTAQLAADASRIAADEAALDKQAEQIQPLVDEADAAAEVGQSVWNRARELRTQIADSTKAALLIAETTTARRSANDELDDANKVRARFEQELAATIAEVTAAEKRKGALERQDRAALIAADVHPGDCCPVCRQQVPASFEADATPGTDEMRKARAALDDATELRGKINGELAVAKARIITASQAVSNSVEKLHAAELDAQRAADATRTQFDEFSSLVARVGGTFDAAASFTTLAAVMDTLAAPTGHVAQDQTLTEPITSAISRCEEAVSAHITRLRENELRATLTIKSDRETLANHQRAHLSAVEEAGTVAVREAEAIDRTAAEVRGLPVRIRNMLAGEILDITDESVLEATDAVTAAKSDIEILVNAREAARQEMTDVLTQQHQLDQETNQLLDRPLADLQSALGTWAKELHRAIDYLDDGKNQVPRFPAEAGVDETRTLLTELCEITAEVNSDLASAYAAHTLEYEQATAKLVEEARQLPDVPGVDATVDWTRPQSVHPLIEAMTEARKDAKDWRTAESVAKAQIQQAADLDFAIAAGEARYAALNVLRREFVDAKFLGHLTTLNTQTLLGIASTLLGQLTENQFGFAPNCDIVSRSSQVEHSANRLSGGEKFLASLALALALAELHSLNGPRLGSLFLDEGFATLDTDALQSALDVLRAQTGEERLVMVISHLHAVAEAVDDVLWVERPTGGSSIARWLSADERDELVNADLASGLQALT